MTRSQGTQTSGGTSRRLPPGRRALINGVQFLRRTIRFNSYVEPFNGILGAPC